MNRTGQSVNFWVKIRKGEMETPKGEEREG